MYKALYTFKKTHPTSLSFSENDLFIELPGASGDKNWHYVLTVSGQSGFVPKNYVVKEDISNNDFLKTLESVREKVKLGSQVDRERGDLLAKLDVARKTFIASQGPEQILQQKNVKQLSRDHQEEQQKQEPQESGVICQEVSQPTSQKPQQQQIQATEMNSRSISPRSSTPPKASKKRAAPPPPRAGSTTRSSESPDRIDVCDAPNPQSQKKTNLPRRKSSGSGRKPSITDTNSTDRVLQGSRELVEMVREHTGLSHAVSTSTVQMILYYLTENFQKLDRNVPALLEEVERPATSNGKVDTLRSSPDAAALEKALEELSKRKEDDQQRNWMLHKDEHIILSLLQTVINILQNAQKEVALYVLQKFKYFYVHSLVEYYQMETRWSLRQKLIETFMQMCSLDTVIISLMVNSVLPTELAQDLFQNTNNVDRLRHCGLLLTVILSRGEPLPVHYMNHLGESFAGFLLDQIENPPSREHEREVCDVFIGLLLSYNLQFKEKGSNITVKSLMRRSSAKAFTEQLLLLLNREEDPTAILTPGYDDPFFDNYDPAQVPTNATHKMVLDIFQDKHCYELFYTNDLYVLIDIIVRQLSDLSSDDVKRKWYATLCQLVLLRSNYSDHLHRFKDLERCFMRILDEEESTTEKSIIEHIVKDVPAFQSLGDTDQF